MTEFLDVVFRSFWTFFGTLCLVYMPLVAVAEIIRAWRGKR